MPALGTAHADYFYGVVPCTRELSEKEVNEAYKLNTGKVIIQTINKTGYDPMAIHEIVVKIMVRLHGGIALLMLFIMQLLWKM